MNVTKLPLPSVEEIQAEAEWIEKLIQKTNERIHAAEGDVRQSLHLELCKAEQHAYLAGLLYALGHSTILDRLEVLTDLEFRDGGLSHPAAR
jgi:hypothetical protein